MTTTGGNRSHERGAPGLSPLKRYGPLVGVVLVIVVIAVVVTVAGKKDSAPSTASAGGTTPASGGDVPITYQEARAQGREASIQWVDNCDPATGRIKVPSTYAPPCVPKPGADNGGAIGPGVTADKVTIVRYVMADNADVLSRLASNLDPKDKAAETTQKFVTYFNDLFETYGRKVEVIDYQSQGAFNDPIAAQADAVAIIEKYRPFASLGGPGLTSAYAEELSRQGVLCFGCGLGFPDQFYQDHAPDIWGPLATPEEYLVNLGDYVTNRVQGRKASFAGDELKDQTRKFGVVHFEQDPPVFTAVQDMVRACATETGWTAAATETYTLDIGKFGERASTIIAKMKEAGVTTIMFLGDPLMPIYLTKAASDQNYHPEWLVTGTVLTDTSVFGRKYDKDQWKHAFGLSSLPGRQPREKVDSWRLHEWYFGEPPAASNTQAILYSPLSQVFLGIHMAGPHLTPETFKAGMFKYPPIGGGPTTPHISYGEHGYFSLPADGKCTSDKPRPDYLAIDDMTEIWWDPTASGPDEQGNVGEGLWRYANNGKRYLPGQMPKTDLDAFKNENSVAIFDPTPAEDVPPSYPSPAKK